MEAEDTPPPAPGPAPAAPALAQAPPRASAPSGGFSVAGLQAKLDEIAEVLERGARGGAAPAASARPGAPALAREVEGPHGPLRIPRADWSGVKSAARAQGGVHAVVFEPDGSAVLLPLRATLTDAFGHLRRLGAGEAAGGGAASFVLSNGSVVDIAPDGTAALTADFDARGLSAEDRRFLRTLNMLGSLRNQPADPALAAEIRSSARAAPGVRPREGTAPLPPEAAALRVPVGSGPRTYRDIFEMRDPVARNEEINAQYHRLSDDMRSYLGAGDVATWPTYGQWASREVGEQIYESGLALDAISDVERMLHADSVLDFGANAGEAARKLWNLATRVWKSKAVGAIIEQGLRLACNEAGFDFDRIRRGDGSWGDVLRLVDKLPTLAASLRATMQNMRQALVEGNGLILANAGPGLETFLRAERAGRDGIQALREAGFTEERYPEFVGAFRRYREAARATDPAEKRRLIEEGNLLFVQHEQAIVAQPFYNRVSGSIRAVTPTVTLHVPGRSGGTEEVNVSRDVPGYPGSGARDWASYDERIKLIAAFFQTQFTNPNLFQAPAPVRPR
jgi:hypothetical protein